MDHVIIYTVNCGTYRVTADNRVFRISCGQEREVKSGWQREQAVRKAQNLFALRTPKK